METSALLTATNENTDLPADYLAMRALYIEGSPDRPLRGMAPTAIRQDFDGTTDTPVAYCLVDGGLVLTPPPSATITLHLDYFARIQGLSDASTSNWLLEKHPDLYWAATISYAYDYVDNDAKAQKYLNYTTALIDQVNRASRNDRFGAGPLVPNLQGQVWQARC
jgi:hypothetical protein